MPLKLVNSTLKKTHVKDAQNLHTNLLPTICKELYYAHLLHLDLQS